MIRTDANRGLDRASLFALCVCSAASIAPLWVVTFPPLVDLPQHAAQVATRLRWDSSEFDYSQYFWIDSASSYVITNLVAYGLAHFLSVVTSFKIVISAALVGLPLSTWVLVRETNGNPWWAALAIPAAFSFPFFMGFVAFCVALPLALLTVIVALRYADEPVRRRGWLLFALLQLLFITHSLVFGWAGLVAAGFVAARSPSWRDTVLRWLPLLAAVVLPTAWFFFALQIDPVTQTGTFGELRPVERAVQLPSLLAGWPHGAWATALGVLLLALPLLTGGRPSSDPARWIPLVVTLLIYLLTPFGFFGTGFLHERFAAVLLPSWLFGLRWRAPEPQRRGAVRRRGLALAALALAWSLAMVALFRANEAEQGALREFIDQIPANAVVLYLPFDNESDVLPYPVYLHSGLWYHVRRGGLVEFSFAKFFQNRFRYRSDHAPKLPPSIEWRPQDFDWHEHDGERYDFILARSDSAPADALRRSRVPWLPLAQAQGGWWLWGPPKEPGPLEESP